MTVRMLTSTFDIGFTTWTKCDSQFGRYPFNEYQIDLTEVINQSPELLEGIITARSTLKDVELLDDRDIF